MLLSWQLSRDINDNNDDDDKDDNHNAGFTTTKGMTIIDIDNVQVTNVNDNWLMIMVISI